jgi:tRNA modification GTPase
MNPRTTPDLRDTIVALSSAPGPGARAVVRLSGPDAVSLVVPFWTGPALAASRRALVAGTLTLTEIHGSLPADVYVWPEPKTYTGQTVVEIHVLSSPPLVDVLIAQLLSAGARAARPGEFTMRAFLAGKLDLTRAEAVLGVIEADSREDLRQALTQLAGGIGRPMQGLRDDVLNLVADVEAALDFADDDIRFVGQDQTLKRLAAGLAQLTLLKRQLEQRGVSERPFRAVLAGRPNAGKSSLFNALTGAAALVSPEPGTTRDYLVGRLDLGDGVAAEIVDTAGLGPPAESIEADAQALGSEQAGRADLVLLCVEAAVDPTPEETSWLRQAKPSVVGIGTKCDLAQPPPGWLATSAKTGAGLDALRALLADRVRSRAQPPLAPSLSRCRHHVDACLDRLRRAHALVLDEEPPELLAVELREALEQLGEMVGAVYTDDLLDRIFSRFCIGK